MRIEIITLNCIENTHTFDCCHVQEGPTPSQHAVFSGVLGFANTTALLVLSGLWVCYLCKCEPGFCFLYLRAVV